MKLFKSFSSSRIRKIVVSAYAISSLIPLLVLVFVFLQYISPHLPEKTFAEVKNIFSYAAVGMLLVSLLGFILLTSWIKSLENLTQEVKIKTAEVLSSEEDVNDENEMLALKHHFDGLYLELQSKISLLNEYSNRLIDSNIKLSEQAVTDSLTGLYNRRHFDERLLEETSRADRYEQELSLIMIDVDGFKKYNDVYGHLAGDEVLRNIGALIRSSIRRSDLPFRYGGDEFVIILPQCNLENAAKIAQKLVRMVKSHEFTIGQDAQDNISISCGVACGRGDLQNLVANADKGLYKAKTSGKGKVVFVSTRGSQKNDTQRKNNGPQ